MKYSKQNIADFIRDPIRLSVVSMALFLVLILGSGSIHWIEGSELGRTPWLMSASTMLLFSIFNAIFLLFTDEVRVYWRNSIYSFMGLFVITGLIAWLISGLSLGELGNFRSVLLVLTISYVIFLIIVTTVRRIVLFSRKRDREKLARDRADRMDEQQ